MMQRSRTALPALCLAAGLAMWATSTLSGAFVSGALRGQRASNMARRSSEPWIYAKPGNVADTFWNDAGYLVDGTAMHLAGNALNHPETIGKDTSVPGWACACLMQC